MKNLLLLVSLFLFCISAVSFSQDVYPDKITEVLNQKLIEGVEYYAYGNEPSWTLDVDIEGNVTFKLMGDSSPISLPYKKLHKRERTNGLILDNGVETPEIKITFTQEKCTDNMSGITNDYKVEITLDKKEYSGCGNKIDTDGDISGAWKLWEYFGNNVEYMDFLRAVPTLNIDLTKKTISGNSSCNSFSVPVYYAVNGKIDISDVISSTKMACDDNFEELFFDNLKKIDSYKIEKGRLKLFNGYEKLMEFERLTR